MHIEVDQSGRIEYTRVKTVLAFSNKTSRAIVIPAQVKREAVKLLRARGKLGKPLYLKLFTTGIFLLIKDYLNQLEQVTIDIEYQGQEGDIKGMLLYYIRRLVSSFPKEDIVFRRITKKSPAHHKAIETYRGNLKPDHEVTLEQLEEVLVRV